MASITVRPHRVSDAKRFYEILINPNFEYFGVKVDSVEDERKWLKGHAERVKKNFEHNFAILYNGKVVGSIGIKIDQHRKFIGEIGYFLDEAYWGKGITTKALALVEKIGFSKLKLKRIEIVMDPKNKASEKVAIKNGYKKEGLMRKKTYCQKTKKYCDAYMYAKVK
jgi:ribosomal-protein-alanine N-acetyltransferase